MSPASVLQGGTQRRRNARRTPRGRGRPPRRPRARAVLLVLLMAAGVVLLIAHGLDGGSSKKSGARTPRAPVRPFAPVRPEPVRPAYATLPAAPAERVPLRFKHPPRSALLWDVRTGRVLFARRPDRVLPIASLTKMMTAILVVDRQPPSARVLVTREALAYKGSGVGILPRGRRIRLETMLYGLLLPSGNDAAIALAQRVGGTVPRFVRLMNARGQRLGLRCTHFTSVDGFDDRGTSCATDLALLTREFMSRRRLARIVRKRRASLPFVGKIKRLDLFNNNPLIRSGFPGTTGVKTGYTDKAGHCLVATVRRGGTTLGVVLLHSPDTGDQASRMFKTAFRRLQRA